MAIRRWRSAPHAVSVACLLVATSGACTSPAPAGPDARHGTVTVPSTASPPESVPSNCTFTLAKGPLPEWAREGFSTPDGWPFTITGSGNIVAVLFGYPMRASRNVQEDGTNKILWISKGAYAMSMTVDAQLVGSTERVSLGDVPVGPSIVDLPDAGCWHLTLHLNGDPTLADTVDITYQKG